MSRRRWLVESDDGRFARRASARAVVRWTYDEWANRPARFRITLDGATAGDMTSGGFWRAYVPALREAFLEVEN